MKRGFWYFLVFTLISGAVLATDIDFYGGLEEVRWDGKQKLRLLAVHPSEIPGDVLLKTLLAPEGSPKTRHGDLLVHALLANDDWLQSLLVREGKALVMPVHETHEGRLYQLKLDELGARLKNKGLWAENPIVCADSAERAFDTFAIVQGRLVEAANVGGTVYLNFGADYREDFTVKISPKVVRSLPETTRKELNRLTGNQNPDMVVEARGWVFYSGGPMIEIAVGAQLDFFETDDPLILERCT